MGVGLGWEHDRVWLHVPSKMIRYETHGELVALVSHTEGRVWSSLASFPGRVGGEKTAWYPLLAHARAFPKKTLGICFCL